MGVIEQMFNYYEKQKEPILDFKNLDTKDNNKVNEMYIEVLQKEIELECELVRDIGYKYFQGSKLDEDDIQGRKYQLEMRLKERERLNPLPF